METASEYMPVEVFAVTRRLNGKWASSTVSLSNFSACESCGAPKGFICLNWEPGEHSCLPRCDRWMDAGKPGWIENR
jgi:hypothetical protein